MLYRLQKFVVGSLHVALLAGLLLTVFGASPLGFANSLVGLSLGWLLLARFQLPEARQSFEDRMARRLVFIPLILAAASAVLAILLDPISQLALVGLLELAAASLIHLSYRQGGKAYLRVGSGYLPARAWLNMPFKAIQVGDLILTDGRMARRSRNSMGHSELVLADAKGKLIVFSSWIETGAVVHTLRALIAQEQKIKENYIVLRLNQPLNAEQIAEAYKVVERMLAANEVWKEKVSAYRKSWYEWLPMPAGLRAWLLKYGLSTGYDVIGKYWGGERKDRWSCMAANLYVLRAVGVPMGEYGTGAFGICGEVNPMLPIRFLKDPAYRLLTLDDESEFNTSTAAGGK